MLKKLQKYIRKYFFPDKVVKSIYDIDFSILKNRGYKVILIDIDNTLMPHGSHAADKNTRLLMKNLRELDLVPCVCSNAVPDRLKDFCDSVQVERICNAQKPKPDAINKYMEVNEIKRDEIIMIGDQLITDVCAANRANIKVILSEPISKKEMFWVQLKRPLEKILICLGGRKTYEELREVPLDSL